MTQAGYLPSSRRLQRLSTAYGTHVDSASDRENGHGLRAGLAPALWYSHRSGGLARRVNGDLRTKASTSRQTTRAWRTDTTVMSLQWSRQFPCTMSCALLWPQRCYHWRARTVQSGARPRTDIGLTQQIASRLLLLQDGPSCKIRRRICLPLWLRK